MIRVTQMLDHPEQSSEELVAGVATIAREIDESGEAQQDYDHSVLIAAALIMRDGNADQRREHGEWAAAQFEAALVHSEDPVHRHREGLRFNPIGIAALGSVAAVRHGGGVQDARALLQLAARGDPAAAYGFSVAMESLLAIDPRLPKSLLRCAFTGNVRPYLLWQNDKDGQDAVTLREIEALRSRAVEAEWVWLQDGAPEPPWPTFPSARVDAREKHFIGRAPATPRKRVEARPRFYTDHQAAAIWLSKFLGRESVPDWLRPVSTLYRDWTSTLNGAGLDRSDQLSNSPSEWNSAYFGLVARSLPGLGPDEIDALCLAPIVCLPDESFLDVVAKLIPAIDDIYFNSNGVSPAEAGRLRTALARRIEETSSWQNHRRRPRYGIESHLGGALAAMFFCSPGFREAPRCYVTALGIQQIAPFISLLAELATVGASLIAAVMVLSIVSASPDYPFLEFGVGALRACQARFPDDTKFWVDYGIGSQFCKWIEGLVKSKGARVLDDTAVRLAVEEIVSNLIRLGIADAATLETALTS